MAEFPSAIALADIKVKGDEMKERGMTKSDNECLLETVWRPEIWAGLRPYFGGPQK
jgi:hypothetical protein